MKKTKKSDIQEEIEKLFEPTARAITRIDKDQMTHVLKKLPKIWQAASAGTKKKSEEQLIALGMRYAIEDILGVAYNTADNNMRHQLFDNDERVKPALFTLATRAREVATAKNARQPKDPSVPIAELAKALGRSVPKTEDLIYTMENHGLVKQSSLLDPHISISKPWVIIHRLIAGKVDFSPWFL